MRFLPFFAFLLVAACADAPSPEPMGPDSAAARDSVLAVLDRLDTDALVDAFDRTSAFRYRTEVRTEQIGDDGALLAGRTVVADLGPSAEPDVLRIDSTGSFAFGGFDLFASPTSDRVLPADNPAATVLPESPAYLDPQGREAFAFAFAPDTTLGDRRVRVLRIDARPEAGDASIRHARLYFDPATDALVGVRLHQQTESFVFDAWSETSLFLQPVGGRWLPALVRHDVTLDAPFTADRRFRLLRAYGDYAPALSAGR